MIENKMDNRLGFEQWLRSNDVKKPVPSLIISAFDEVSDFAVSRKLSKMTVWEICTARDYTFMRTAVEKNRLFKILHKNAAQIFEKSWRYYAVFLESLNSTEPLASPKEETVVPVASPVDFIQITETPDNLDKSKDYSLDAFNRWLSEEEKMAPASCRGYSSSVKSISEYAVENGWLTRNIYEIVGEEELKEAVAALRSTEAYVDYNDQQHNRFSAAICPFSKQ